MAVSKHTDSVCVSVNPQDELMLQLPVDLQTQIHNMLSDNIRDKNVVNVPVLELLRSRFVINSSFVAQAPIELVELSLRFAEAIRKQWVPHMAVDP